MIISDEQVRLAAEYLRAPRVETANDSALGDVSGDLMERIRASVADVPDIRPDRVAEAKAMLRDRPSAEEVAGKLIGRAVSDSLR